jgi:YfiH family protein
VVKRRFHFWEIREKDGVVFLDFGAWAGVRVLYSTRIGGVSNPPFDSLNLHSGRGDAEQHVRENRRRFFGAVGVDEHRIAFTGQIHSSTVRAVDGCGDVAEGDGMITDRKGLFLGIFTADCLAIFLFAPHAPAIGAIHAGRKGLEASIIEKGIHALCDTYRVKPSSIEALGGPSIGPCCYEVGEELRHSFSGEYLTKRMNRLYLDLWSVAADQLADVGIRKMYLPEICSATHSDLFFSYRKSGKRVGENLGLIGMVSQSGKSGKESGKWGQAGK